MAYPVRDINPSKGCIIQPFCRLYYTTKSSGHKKGASKGVKRPLCECSKKGRKCYILSNWSGIKELPLTLQTGMSGESLLILIPQICYFLWSFIHPPELFTLVCQFRTPSVPFVGEEY